MTTDAEAEARTVTDAAIAAGLSKFQVRLLAVIAAAEEPPSGQTLRRRLGGYYHRRVMGTQLYPNLGELEDLGLVEKGSKDGRTNEYRLTERGQRVIRREADWLAEHALGGEDVE